MIVLLDTSTPECRLWFYQGSKMILHDVWQADRDLAEGIFTYLETQLKKVDGSWSSLAGLGVFQGPGSFTGLRIGVTVLNTIASDKRIPIVGSNSDEWQADCLHRLMRGEDDKIVLPDYGRDARITKPRK